MKFRILLILSSSIVCGLCVAMSSTVWKDCPTGSLTEIYFNKLLLRASVSDKCKQEARREFEMRYKQISFVVDCRMITLNTDPIIENAHHIIIQRIDEFADILEYFGNLMMHVSIIFKDVSEIDGRHIIKLINDNCSKTLKKLVLQECKGTVFEALINPFPKLKMLALTTSATGAIEYTSNTKKLGEIFLNVDKLTLVNLKDTEWPILGTFSNLTELRLVFPKSQNDLNFDESQFENFLKQNNENIYAIFVDYIHLKLLKVIGKIGRLEELEITCFGEHFMNAKLKEGELIRFDTLTKLVIDSDQPFDKMHENLIFDELEEFSLYLQMGFHEDWMKFIDNQVNKYLTEITIQADPLDSKHFLAIARKFIVIESVTIDSSSRFLSDDIVQFLELNQNVQKLSVGCTMLEQEISLLHEKLPVSNWMLNTHFGGKLTYISIQRIQSKKIIVDCDESVSGGIDCEDETHTNDDEDDGSKESDGHINNSASSMNHLTNTLIVILFIAFINQY